MYVFMYSCICACRVRDAELYGQPTYTRTRKKYIFHSAFILRTKERKKKKKKITREALLSDVT